MKYRIIIQKTEETPNYAALVKEWKEEQGGYSRYKEPTLPYPEPTTTTNALVCALTEEEYRKIKAEVFTTFN